MSWMYYCSGALGTIPFFPKLTPGPDLKVHWPRFFLSDLNVSPRIKRRAPRLLLVTKLEGLVHARPAFWDHAAYWRPAVSPPGFMQHMDYRVLQEKWPASLSFPGGWSALCLDSFFTILWVVLPGWCPGYIAFALIPGRRLYAISGNT